MNLVCQRGREEATGAFQMVKRQVKEFGEVLDATLRSLFLRLNAEESHQEVFGRRMLADKNFEGDSENWVAN